MPWKYTDEFYKEYTRTTWNESAETNPKILRWLEPYGSDLLARVDPRIRRKRRGEGGGPPCDRGPHARVCGARRDGIPADAVRVGRPRRDGEIAGRRGLSRRQRGA